MNKSIQMATYGYRQPSKTTPIPYLVPRWTGLLLALHWVIPSHALSTTTILFLLVVGSFTPHLSCSLVLDFLLKICPSSSKSQ